MPARARSNVWTVRRLVQAAALATLVTVPLAPPAAHAQDTPPPGFTPQTAPPPPPGDPGYGYDPAQPPPPGDPGYGYDPAQPPPPYAPPPPGYGYGYGPPAPSVAPWSLPYEDGDPIPPGYHLETNVRKGLVIGGAVTLGTMYVITALTGAILVSIADAVDNSGSAWAPLFAPAVGPFITIGTVGASGGGMGLLILDGAVQTGGLAMLVLGIALPKTVLIRNDASNRSIPSVRVAPMMMGKGTMGIGIIGEM